MKVYQDMLPNKLLVRKINKAISNITGEIEMLIIEPENIDKYNLGWKVKG